MLIIMDWTNIINDACTTILTVAALIGANKKWPGLFKAIQFVEHNAGTVVQVAEEIVKTPFGAAVKHQLEVEVEKVTDKYKTSEIARLALVGMHSFGVSMEALSDVQKAALTKFILESVPVEWKVTPEDIDAVLTDVQRAANDFSKLDIVKAANYFTTAQKSAIKPLAQDGATDDTAAIQTAIDASATA